MTTLTPADGGTVVSGDGIPIRGCKSYGIGIDCHSKFVQVCVLTRSGSDYYAHQKEFPNSWDSLREAKNWCLTVLGTKASPVLDLSGPLHYCIESTATYHMPVILAFGGTPSIVNPTLAGATKRKTDVLDAQLLATHDLVGVWRESFIPSDDINELRVILWERDRCTAEAGSAGKRINNILVRFGYTISRDGSITKNEQLRRLVEAIANGETDLPADLCPHGIPFDVRAIITSEYSKHDALREEADRLSGLAVEKVRSMQWETADGSLPGDEMLRILTSAPQVGTLTAVTWLAHVITPRRFPNPKALSAYCGLDPSLKVSAKHVTSAKTRGGNKALHKALVSSADRLIRNHCEMFGRWGYNLYCQTGKWKKAANAVARKLSVAMYYMMLTGQPFSYDSYNLVKDISVFDIPVDELVPIIPEFKRYIKILHEHDITTTSQMATSYLSCRLGSCRGLGKKFFSVLRDFLNNQHKYKKLYDELHSKTTEV